MKDTMWLVLAASLAAVGCEKANDDEAEHMPAVEQRSEGTKSQQQRMEQPVRQQQQAQQQQAQQQQAQQQQAQQQQAQQQQQFPQTARIDVRTQEPFGKYLVNSEGRALYMFTADTRGQRSDCYDQCAEMWPPVLTRQDPQAAARDVRGNMLGAIERRDGTRQVTYNGWPLYTYARDTRAGQTTGQDVHGFGGGWYLMAPSGERIERQQPRASR